MANFLLYARMEKRVKYEKEWFRETVYLPFDEMNLPCPECYDKVLKEEDGDYMTPIKNNSFHIPCLVFCKDMRIELSFQTKIMF